MAQFLKRIISFVIILLLAISVYDDLVIKENPQTEIQQSDDANEFKINQKNIQIQVKSGDTVLSVTETLNSDLHTSVDIEKIISDFKHLNPGTDPYQLKAGEAYAFPIYSDNL